MKLRGWIMVLLMLSLSMPLAIAQSGKDAAAGDAYVPRLGDIMDAAQLRHMKLWFAGKSLNWNLANYEVGQLKASLMEAASLYAGIPVTNVTTMVTPVQSVADAIEAKNGAKFVKAFGELTAGCNACHQSMGRGFVVIQVPTASPFSNQSFAPQGKP